MNKKVIYDRKYNFILTDHLAGVTTDNKRRERLVFENIEAFINNDKLKYEVSKTKGY